MKMFYKYHKLCSPKHPSAEDPSTDTMETSTSTAAMTHLMSHPRQCYASITSK